MKNFWPVLLVFAFTATATLADKTHPIQQEEVDEVRPRCLEGEDDCWPEPEREEADPDSSRQFTKRGIEDEADME